MAAVREHLATCPESHAEFEELGGVVPYLLDDPRLELVEPPAALRDRIMAAAAADLAARTRIRAGRARQAPPAAAEPRRRSPSRRPPSARPAPSARDRARSTGRCGSRRSSRSSRSAPGTCSSRASSNAAQPIRSGRRGRHQRRGPARQPDGRPRARPRTRRRAASRPFASDGSVVLAMREPSGDDRQPGLRDVGDRRRRGARPGRRLHGRRERASRRSRPGRPTRRRARSIALTREPKAGNTAPEGPVVSAGSWR